jgi:hypothetical protein
VTIANHFRACLVLLAALIAFGCGERADQPASDDASTSAADDRLAGKSQEWRDIQAMLDEVITRWRYRDKTVLYDLEFEYIRDQFTYDEYHDIPQIKHVHADTVYSLELLSLTLFDEGDSARGDVLATLISTGGDTIEVTDNYPFYYRDGRWIRPTIGSYIVQRDYDSLQQEAIEAARREAEMEAEGR